MSETVDEFDLPEAPAERVQLVVERVLDGLGMDGEVVVAEDDDAIHAKVEGEDLGLFIGKHGHTIDAVQLLCLQTAFRDVPERKRVVVDAAGYRERRESILRSKADRAAERALATGNEIEMDSMSAVERRVVHTHLRDRDGIETFSEGDEPERFVVVAPAEPE
jgi:spoIIIJ-associated protein